MDLINYANVCAVLALLLDTFSFSRRVFSYFFFCTPKWFVNFLMQLGCNVVLFVLCLFLSLLSNAVRECAHPLEVSILVSLLFVLHFLSTLYLLIIIKANLLFGHFHLPIHNLPSHGKSSYVFPFSYLLFSSLF